MNDIEINDNRTESDFRLITFSNYKKTVVVKQLLNSLVASKIEPACNWAAELICAGHYAEVWETILVFLGKYIHIGNPKLPIYIEMRFNNFKDILINGYSDNEIGMRNNEKIRKLFAEIISVLCFSRKKHSFESIKIKKTEEFDITHMTSKFKAPHTNYGKDSFMSEDPKELFMAINEFAYHISPESKNMVSACYWIEWIIELETIYKQRKEKCSCERRQFAPVHEKYQMDIIWIIWDVLLKTCKTNANQLTNKIMQSLINIFSIKYSGSVKKRRRYLLYFAVSLLTEHIDYNIEMIGNKEEVDIICSKINMIYKNIKKNEITPATDYLFNGVERSNREKTIEKLEIMKKINAI